jgi:TatD DNase family protein
VIDSHCHLADETFSADLEGIVSRAREAGIERALVVLTGGDSREAVQADRVGRLWPEIRVAIGVHPHVAHVFADEPARAAVVVRDQLARTALARAIGEIGLDYHYDFTPRETQQEVFRVQLQLARELRHPVVIHTREADEDTITMLRSEGGGELRGVLHCFTGGVTLARAGLDLGFHVSLAGIVTFPKATDLRETARTIPLDRLLVETDSPYLAPVPHRGQRNEPAFLPAIVNALAGLYQVHSTEIAERTSANFHALFRP